MQLGKYQIVGLVGQGGMGKVYRALDPRLDREVALKVVSASASGDEVSAADQNARLLREAKAAARLKHRNVVAIYDFGEDGDRVFIVMELLEGHDLKRLIATPPAMPRADKLDVMVQICDGLAYAHQRGVIHRDVKPGNIFVQPDGQVKILDFGLARSAGGTSLTLTRQIFGTIAYMAPERFRGVSDMRGDIFAVGAVCYELLAGRRAFIAPNPEALMKAIETEEPPRLTGLPADLVAAVEWALRKDPAARIPDLATMRATLERVRQRVVQEGETATRVVPPAPPLPTPPSRTAALVRRLITLFRRFRVALSISLTVTAAAIYLVNLGQWRLFDSYAPRIVAVAVRQPAAIDTRPQVAEGVRAPGGNDETPASPDDKQLPARISTRPPQAPVAPRPEPPPKPDLTSKADVTPKAEPAPKIDVDRIAAEVVVAHRAAVKSAAPFWAPQLMAAARTKEDDAAAALRRANHAEAAKLLAEAKSNYVAAAERARTADDEEQKVASARALVTQWRGAALTRRAESADAHAERLARDEFEEAEAAHRRADEMDRSGDFAAAAGAYEAAAEKYAQATRRAAAPR